MSTARQFNLFAGLCIVGALLSACHAKGPDMTPAIPTGGPVPTNPTPAGNQVNGPDLKGNWKTDCTAWAPGKYVRLTYQFKPKQVVVRFQDVFDDAKCSHMIDFAQQGAKYRFVQKYGNDIYELEMLLPGPNGFENLHENIRVPDDKTLLVSFRASGANVVPTTPMKPVDDDGNPLKP